MTEDEIKHMVDRFLGWRLPDNFNPDGGVSFKKTFNEHTAHPMEHEPSGTNLFDATQADAMIRYLIEGLPARSPAPHAEVRAQTIEECAKVAEGMTGTADGAGEIYIARKIADEIRSLAPHSLERGEVG